MLEFCEASFPIYGVRLSFIEIVEHTTFHDHMEHLVEQVEVA